MDTVIALKPKWLNLIMQGKKTVECRKQYPTQLQPGDKVYLYCKGQIHGYLIPYDVQAVQPDDITDAYSCADMFHEEACLPLEEMGAYLYAGRRPGLIFFKEVHQYETPEPWNYAPPQNYAYMDNLKANAKQLRLVLQ